MHRLRESKMNARPTALLGSCLLLGLLLSGCTNNVVSPLASLPWKPHMPTATPENPVVRVVAIWQTAEGTGLDNQPTRGFAGQLYFFTSKRKSPVKVNGKVRIFEFDDVGTHEEQTKPIHQFDFPAEVWDMYLTETQIGPAYEIFIPYVREGNREADCALRVRYTPEESGPQAYSDLQTIHLTGTPRKDKEQKADVASDKASTDEAAKTAEAEQRPSPTRSATIRDSHGQITPDRIDQRLDRWKEQMLEDTRAEAPTHAAANSNASPDSERDERLSRIEATLLQLLSERSEQNASHDAPPVGRVPEAGAVQQAGYFEPAEQRQSRRTPQYVADPDDGRRRPDYVREAEGDGWQSPAYESQTRIRPQRHSVRHPLEQDAGDEEPRLFRGDAANPLADDVRRETMVPRVESRSAFDAHPLAEPLTEPRRHPLLD
jgi:hypothetical protein